MGGKLRFLGLALAAFVLTPAVAVAAPTRSQYIAQLEPICNTYNPAEESAVEQGFDSLFRNRGRKARRSFIGLGQLGNAEVAAIAKVQPPAGDEGLITTWVNSMHTEAVFAGRMAKTRKGFRPRNEGRFLQTFILLIRLIPVQDYNTKFAPAYGFVSCAQPLVPAFEDHGTGFFGKKAGAGKALSAR
jgi:hypothetical protein